MTIVGKIFVIINLLFSLVVGFLLVIDFATRSSWKAAYEREKAVADVADAAKSATESKYNEKAGEVDEVAKDYKVREADLNAIIKQKQDELDSALTTLQKTRREADNNALEVSKLQDEVSRIQAQVTELDRTSKQKDLRMAELVKERTEYQQAAVTYKIQVQTLVQRLNILETQLADCERRLEQRVAQGGGTLPGGPERVGVISNPPPENVQGVIREVDADARLVKISVGSDSGLQKGHTLEVYRPDLTNPNCSKYLGTIRILDVRAKEAVGTPVRGMGRLELKEGDRVTGKL